MWHFKQIKTSKSKRTNLMLRPQYSEIPMAQPWSHRQELSLSDPVPQKWVQAWIIMKVHQSRWLNLYDLSHKYISKQYMYKQNTCYYINLWSLRGTYIYWVTSIHKSKRRMCTWETKAYTDVQNDTAIHYYMFHEDTHLVDECKVCFISFIGDDCVHVWFFQLEGENKAQMQ